jgi:Asp-tRNA(Asn)/Glu-tRNA(Gln) amidotransferase A subunit family amidase
VSGQEILKLSPGCPTANVPLGYLDITGKGRPVGLTLIGRPGGESGLLEIQRAWEAVFPKRREPPVVTEGENPARAEML